MNDSNPAPSPETKSGESGIDIGRVILYAILFVVLACIGWHFLVAIPSHDRAMNEMMKKQFDSKIAVEGGLTTDMVRETMGFSPSVKDWESGVRMETYRWLNLNPFDSLVISVAYLKAEDSDNYVVEEVYFKVPTDDEVAQITNFDGGGDAAFGGGGGGEGGPGGGGPGGGEGGPGGGGGGFDPSTIFTRLDADEDGKLSAEEIAESRNPEGMTAGDTNKDGEISLEEFTAIFANRSGGGRGGAGGGEGGRGDGGRGEGGRGGEGSEGGRPQRPSRPSGGDGDTSNEATGNEATGNEATSDVEGESAEEGVEEESDSDEGSSEETEKEGGDQ